MATKTFEELKQMAIQIRDEKANKHNTATRIGTQMIEHLTKLEQEYYDKGIIDEQNKENDRKLSELVSTISEEHISFSRFYNIKVPIKKGNALDISIKGLQGVAILHVRLMKADTANTSDVVQPVGNISDGDTLAFIPEADAKFLQIIAPENANYSINMLVVNVGISAKVDYNSRNLLASMFRNSLAVVNGAIMNVRMQGTTLRFDLLGVSEGSKTVGYYYDTKKKKVTYFSQEEYNVSYEIHRTQFLVVDSESNTLKVKDSSYNDIVLILNPTGLLIDLIGPLGEYLGKHFADNITDTTFVLQGEYKDLGFIEGTNDYQIRLKGLSDGRNQFGYYKVNNKERTVFLEPDQIVESGLTIPRLSGLYINLLTSKLMIGNYYGMTNMLPLLYNASGEYDGLYGQWANLIQVDKKIKEFSLLKTLLVRLTNIKTKEVKGCIDYVIQDNILYQKDKIEVVSDDRAYQEIALKFYPLKGKTVAFELERDSVDAADNRLGGIYFYKEDGSLADLPVIPFIGTTNGIISTSKGEGKIPKSGFDFALFFLYLNRRTALEDGTTVTFTKIKVKYKTENEGWNTSELPAYYFADNYIDNKANELNNEVLLNESISDNFIFFTDNHLTANTNCQTPALIRHLTANTIVSKAIFGGDVVQAYGTKNDLYKTMKRFMGEYTFPKLDLLLLGVRGNHDFTIRKNAEENVGYTYPQSTTHDIILSRQEISDCVFNSEDPSGCYYYFDNKVKKIRYVMFDTTDSVSAGNVAWGTHYGINDTQMQWLIENAIMTAKEDWHFVFIGHIPPLRTIGDTALENIVSLISSINNRVVSVNINNKECNFSDFTSKVVLSLSGHIHQDLQTFKDGCLYSTTACDARYGDYKKSPWMSDAPTRTQGTINEQCFDIFNLNISKGIISAIRIGGGYNRYFHITPITIHKGATKQLTPDKLSPINYDCHDSEGNTNDSDWTWNLKKTVVSVSQTGLVTGVATGEALVVAIASNGYKEFFYFIVE